VCIPDASVIALAFFLVVELVKPLNKPLKFLQWQGRGATKIAEVLHK
jgi:hypothetical protein